MIIFKIFGFVLTLKQCYGRFMRNHEFVKSGAYPYGFAPDVDAWREVAKYKDRDASASFSTEVPALGNDLDPLFNLVGKPVMEDFVSSLLGLSLNS
ncbi:hypothetical protein AYI68_g6078 [Smittium mucronatum]|uniref:Uncharacterized protein n=1 Tax=Smittium mucronatum TaxID=133383 RepID=A0A1R0GSF4_9FUNG|nr:hypothetical protein AYI68_g6078 [Smittium mucronatum]